MKHNPQLLAAAALALFAPAASAQVLTSRSSTLNFNYVYGAGGDSHTGSVDRPRGTLLPSDADTTGFSGEAHGVLPGGEPYTASVSCHLEQGYSITGSLREIGSLSAHALTNVTASASGVGSATMQALNPGNEIMLSFSVLRSVGFHLTGSITIPAASAFSYVAIQRFNGFNWEYVFYSAFLPGGQGPFDVTGTFIPSDYRILSDLNVSAGANQSFEAGYTYLLDVPDLAACPADFNLDSEVDPDDLADYIGAFFAAPPAAGSDFNNDGTTDPDDLADFIGAFFAGC